MKILQDLWDSIKGYAKVRVNDPILGTFIVSWSIFNWDKIALLFLGGGTVDNRVNSLVEKMSITRNPKIIFSDCDLILFPVLFTVLYILVFPWLTLGVKKLQNKVTLLQYDHAVNLDIEQVMKQKNLNKALLRANPEKEFLAKEIEIDLNADSEISIDKVQRRIKLTDYIEKKREIVSSIAELKKSEVEKDRIESQHRQRLDIREKQRYEMNTAIHNATLATHRFPTVYYFLDLLSKSLTKDDVILKFETLTDCISAIFGYDDFSALLKDQSFNNDNFNKIKYLYCDTDYLTTRLRNAVIEECSDNEDITDGLIFDHIQMILEKQPYKFLSGDAIAEILTEEVNMESNDIINSNVSLMDAMAETDTYFEELEFEMNGFEFKDELNIYLYGVVSGNHRKELDVAGQELIVKAIASCRPVIGKYGLSEYELEISVEPNYN